MINGIMSAGISPYAYAYNVGRQKEAMQPQTVRQQETAQNWLLFPPHCISPLSCRLGTDMEDPVPG